MATETFVTNFEAFADPHYDGLFEADAQLSLAFAEAVTESENLAMLKASVVALGLTGHQPTTQELLVPYKMIADNLQDQKRVSQLVEFYDSVYELKDKDPGLLYDLCLRQEGYTKHCVRKFNLLLPDNEITESSNQATLSSARQKLDAYAIPNDQRRLDQQAINEMIEAASSFVGTAGDNDPKLPRISAYVHFLEPLKRALPQLSEDDIRTWLDYARFTIGLTDSTETAQVYNFYDEPGRAPAPDKVLDVYEQAEAAIVGLVEKLVEQDPRKLVASLVAAAAITSAIPSISNRHNTQTVSLASAERQAALTILAKVSAPNTSVQLSPAAESVMQNVAQGGTVEPQVLTTAAVLASPAPEANHITAPVSIAGVTSVHNSSETAQPVGPPNALVVEAAPNQVPGLYESYKQLGAQTLIVDPAKLPAGTADYIDGHAVNTPAALAALGKDAAGKVIVSIDPTVKPESPAPTLAPTTVEATPSTTATPTTTLKPNAPVTHHFDPSNPVDATYLALSKFTSNNQVIFAIEGNGTAEGRLHPQTLQGNPAGVYQPIESLSPYTLNSTSYGYGDYQWTPVNKLKFEAAQLGVNADTLPGQTAVIWHDLQQPDIKNPGHTYEQSIDQAPDLRTATKTMEEDFERPATTADAPIRENYAAAEEAYVTRNVPLPFSIIPLTDSELGTTSPAAPAPTTTTPTTSTTVVPTTASSTTQPTTPDTVVTVPAAGQDPNSTSQWLANWSSQSDQQSTQSPAAPNTPSATSQAASPQS